MSKVNHADARRQKAAARKEKQRRQERIILVGAVAAAVVAALCIFLFQAPSGLYAGWTTAVEVGPYKVSTAVYNCYYGKAAQELTNLFSMGGMGAAPGGAGWRDAVIQQTNKAVQDDFAVCAAAQAAGYVLDDADKAAVEEEIALIQSMAESNGYSNADQYLSDTLGRGTDLESYRSFVEHFQLAQSYRDEYYNSLSFEAEEIQEAYAAAPGDFDMVTFRSFYLEGASEAAAQEAALSVTDEASFSNMARQYAKEEDQEQYESDDATLETMLVSRLNADNRAWLTDSGRKYGDVGVVPYQDSGYFILYYVGMNQDEAARDSAVQEQLKSEAFEQWHNDILKENPLRSRWLGMSGVAR